MNRIWLGGCSGRAGAGAAGAAPLTAMGGAGAGTVGGGPTMTTTSANKSFNTHSAALSVFLSLLPWQCTNQKQVFLLEK